MKRRLLNTLTALSLLLCVAAGALWVRSFWAADEVFWYRATGARGGAWQQVQVRSARGRIVWVWTWDPEGGNARAQPQFVYLADRPPQERWGRSTLDRLGFGIMSASAGNRERGWREGAVGLWVAVAVLAAGPAARWVVRPALRRWPY